MCAQIVPDEGDQENPRDLEAFFSVVLLGNNLLLHHLRSPC